MKEEQMIAICGLDCSECKALIATQHNDDLLRAEVAKEWSEQFGANIKPETINCGGCISNGVKFFYCDNLCEIRKCALSKNYKNCGSCAEMPCGKLEFIFKHNEKAREKLRK